MQQKQKLVFVIRMKGLFILYDRNSGTNKALTKPQVVEVRSRASVVEHLLCLPKVPGSAPGVSF